MSLPHMLLVMAPLGKGARDAAPGEGLLGCLICPMKTKAGGISQFLGRAALNPQQGGSSQVEVAKWQFPHTNWEIPPLIKDSRLLAHQQRGVLTPVSRNGGPGALSFGPGQNSSHGGL